MKNAKKSMVLTTVIIIALLIVALSTATFAWFSASSTVNVSSISFTAEISEGNDDLVISWTMDPAKFSKELKFAPVEKMTPMIPNMLPSISDKTDLDSFLESVDMEGEAISNFNTASQAYIESADEYRFSSKPVGKMPSFCTDADDTTHLSFLLINKNPEFDMSVTVSYTIANAQDVLKEKENESDPDEYEVLGGNEDALCVAIFVDNVFCGIMTNKQAISYGTIVQGQSIEPKTTNDPTTGIALTELTPMPNPADPEHPRMVPDPDVIRKTNQIKIRVKHSTADTNGDITAYGSVRITLVAWYDGNDIENSDGGKVAELQSLMFTGEFVG